MSDSQHPSVSDGVGGRFSALANGTLDDFSTGSDIEKRFGFRKSRSKKKSNVIYIYNCPFV